MIEQVGETTTNPAVPGQNATTLDGLQAAPYNPREITKHDFGALKQSIKAFGDLSGIVFNRTTGQLVGGHQRVSAFKELPNPTIVIEENLASPNSVGTVARGYVLLGDEKYTYRIVEWDLQKEKTANIAANRIQGTFNKDALATLMESIDADQRSMTGMMDKEIDDLLAAAGDMGAGEAKKLLTDTFIVPPFSILDTKAGYWQQRARAWGKLMGDVSATREGTLGMTSLAGDAYGGKAFAASGVSELDPVLCEVAYRWFTPIIGSTVFNPFGGEPVSAFVGGYLGYPYYGTELRPEQVAATNDKIKVLGTEAKAPVQVIEGDARKCAELWSGSQFDLIFSSPPFYDLEVYSAREDDLSNQGTYEEFMAGYKEAFAGAVSMLRDNRFVVINVTEIRDKNGVYRNFVGDNVELFTSLGLHFYNDLIIANAIGTAAIRAARNMGNRKVVRIHQNLLVFYKGDVSKIKDNFGELEVEVSDAFTSTNGDAPTA